VVLVNQVQLVVFAAPLLVDPLNGNMGLGADIGLVCFFRDTQLGSVLVDRLHLGLTGDFDIGGHARSSSGWPAPPRAVVIAVSSQSRSFRDHEICMRPIQFYSGDAQDCFSAFRGLSRQGPCRCSARRLGSRFVPTKEVAWIRSSPFSSLLLFWPGWRSAGFSGRGPSPIGGRGMPNATRRLGSTRRSSSRRWPN